MALIHYSKTHRLATIALLMICVVPVFPATTTTCVCTTDQSTSSLYSTATNNITERTAEPIDQSTSSLQSAASNTLTGFTTESTVQSTSSLPTSISVGETVTQIHSESTGGVIITTSNSAATGDVVTTISNSAATGDVITTTSNSAATDDVITTTSNSAATGYVITTTSNSAATGDVITTTSNSAATDDVITTTSNSAATGYVITTTSNSAATGDVITTTSNSAATGDVVTTISNSAATGDVITTTSNSAATGYVITTTSNSAATGDVITTTSNSAATGDDVTTTSDSAATGGDVFEYVERMYADDTTTTCVCTTETLPNVTTSTETLPSITTSTETLPNLTTSTETLPSITTANEVTTATTGTTAQLPATTRKSGVQDSVIPKPKKRVSLTLQRIAVKTHSSTERPIFHNISFALNTTANLTDDGEYNQLVLDVTDVIYNSFQSCPGFRGLNITDVLNDTSPEPENQQLAVFDDEALNFTADQYIKVNFYYTVYIDILENMRNVNTSISGVVIDKLITFPIENAEINENMTRRDMENTLRVYMLEVENDLACDLMKDSDACAPCYNICGIDKEELKPLCYVQCVHPKVCKLKDNSEDVWETACVCDKSYLPVSGSCVHEDLIIGLSAGLGGALVLGLVIAVVLLSMSLKKNKSKKSKNSLVDNDYLTPSPMSAAFSAVDETGAGPHDGPASVEYIQLTDATDPPQPTTSTFRSDSPDSGQQQQQQQQLDASSTSAEAIAMTNFTEAETRVTSAAADSSSAGSVGGRSAASGLATTEIAAGAAVTSPAEVKEKPQTLPKPGASLSSTAGRSSRLGDGLKPDYDNAPQAFMAPPRKSYYSYYDDIAADNKPAVNDMDDFVPQLSQIDTSKPFLFQRPTLNFQPPSDQYQIPTQDGRNYF